MASLGWLAMIAEFDRRKGWSDSLTQSCAHWLNWQCGLALGAAREKVRVAHALEELPLIGASMARGELSYSKVRELTRVATPATEKYLLDIALHGTASHVERLVRQYRRVQEVEEAAATPSAQTAPAGKGLQMKGAAKAPGAKAEAAAPAADAAPAYDAASVGCWVHASATPPWSGP